jgi:hypothetical protein
MFYVVFLQDLASPCAHLDTSFLLPVLHFFGVITSIFLVITGQNDMSTEMDKVWNETDVVSICNSNGCVAIKIAANR